MRRLNDPGARRLLWAGAGLTGAAALTAGLTISPAAALPPLGLGAALLLLFGLHARRHSRMLDRLSSRIDCLLHGQDADLHCGEREGDLAILESEIRKLLIRLREQTVQLQADKHSLANAMADISHQLRTPLTAMGLLTESLSEASLLPERRRACLRDLRRQLDRMEWLISALLRMSRLEAGAVELQRTPLDLRALAEQAAGPLLIAMELREQTLEISGGGWFLGDGAWTAEALGNVLKNCMEHTPAGGIIRVTVTQNPIYAAVTVEDTGPGIDSEDLPHLFERFYRGKNAGAQSVGIGLALARAILAAQDGVITAGNRPGGGACFTIRLYRTCSSQEKDGSVPCNGESSMVN